MDTASIFCILAVMECISARSSRPMFSRRSSCPPSDRNEPAGATANGDAPLLLMLRMPSMRRDSCEPFTGAVGFGDFGERTPLPRVEGVRLLLTCLARCSNEPIRCLFWPWTMSFKSWSTSCENCMSRFQICSTRFRIMKHCFACAGPFISCNPSKNSSMVKEPSPSSSRLKIDWQSISLKPSSFSLVATSLVSKALWNSSKVSVPELSSSMTSKRARKVFRSRFSSRSFCARRVSSSCLEWLKAFSTMTAVTKFIKTMTATAM
mmetsp:Transcript_107043/g.255566  ORF Transcript_107043/g.255566 Transcript_107043/m.255566 type:complete len:264 (+) Transcript_107043:454-1245(+)